MRHPLDSEEAAAFMKSKGIAHLAVNPPQSLRGGRQTLFPPQGSGFQKSKAQISALFISFTTSNTLVWIGQFTTSNTLVWIGHARVGKPTVLTTGEGFLANKKPQSPLRTPYGPRHGPAVGS